MPLDLTNAAPKVHPATRAVEPEDPMDLHGIEVDGDPEIMLRMLVEDYARMGCGFDELMGFFRQSFYVGFHGLLEFYGEEELARRVRGILSRCGVFRVATRVTTPLSEQLVQLDLSRVLDRRDDIVQGASHEQPD